MVQLIRTLDYEVPATRPHTSDVVNPRGSRPLTATSTPAPAKPQRPASAYEATVVMDMKDSMRFAPLVVTTEDLQKSPLTTPARAHRLRPRTASQTSASTASPHFAACPRSGMSPNRRRLPARTSFSNQSSGFDLSHRPLADQLEYLDRVLVARHEPPASPGSPGSQRSRKLSNSSNSSSLKCRRLQSSNSMQLNSLGLAPSDPSDPSALTKDTKPLTAPHKQLPSDQSFLGIDRGLTVDASLAHTAPAERGVAPMRSGLTIDELHSPESIQSHSPSFKLPLALQMPLSPMAPTAVAPVAVRAPSMPPTPGSPGLARKPTSGAEILHKAKLASRPYGEPVPQTWDDVRRGQKRLETLMKFSLKQKITQQKPVWWKPPLSSTVLEDAHRFDQKHETHVQRAATTLRIVQEKCHELPRANAFEVALTAVQRERLVGQRQGLGGDFVSSKQRLALEVTKKNKGNRSRWRRAFVAHVAAAPKGWDDGGNVWEPRAKTSDSKNLLDSDECLAKAIDLDWERALYYGIGEYVLAHDDDSDAGELDEIRQCLLANRWLVYSAFDYLASLGSGGVNSINSNAYLGFIKDAKIADPGSTNCKPAHLDQLFVLINSLEPPSEKQPRRTVTPPLASRPASGLANPSAAPEAAAVAVGSSQASSKIASAPASKDVSRPGSGNAIALAAGGVGGWSKLKKMGVVKKPDNLSSKIGLGNVHTLERHEWLHALVRIAIMRYVLPGRRTVVKCADVSEALEQLLLQDIKANLPAELAQKSNDFRTDFCYSEAVERVLRTHKLSLLSIFTVFTAADSGDPAKHWIGQRIALDDWMDLVKVMNLLDRDLSERSAVLAFVWSRMRVADEHAPTASKKLASLSFEDFLEAICRIAMQKAWPDEGAVRAAGKDDALEYLLWARENDQKAHTSLLAERAVPWHKAPAINPSECVCHLAKGLIRRTETGAEVTPNGKVSVKEARSFRKKVLGR